MVPEDWPHGLSLVDRPSSIGHPRSLKNREVFHIGPNNFGKFFDAVLLSAHIELLSVSRIQDFFYCFIKEGGVMVMPKAYLIGIGASISIGRESWCFLYAGFL